MLKGGKLSLSLAKRMGNLVIQLGYDQVNNSGMWFGGKDERDQQIITTRCWHISSVHRSIARM